MNGLPSPNTRLYPHTAQMSVTMAIIAKLCIMVPSTFLWRTRPP